MAEKKKAPCRSSREYKRITKRLETARTKDCKDPKHYCTVMQNADNVVEFDNLCTYFFSSGGVVKAVDGVTFEIPKHATVGVVGESGCGKSVTALSLMQLLSRPNGQIVGGEIRFNKGEGGAYNIVKTPNAILEELRGSKMSMIFQEPMTSLNPVYRIGDQIREAILIHHPDTNREQVKARVLELLELVGIANGKGVCNMYPHELSGGMRQRIMIAIALSCNPELLVADEPTTALDVTIQAQILDLLESLKEKIGTSIMLITHDLGVVAGMADYVVVMYAGRVIERGTAKDIFNHPCHPYTLGLMKSRPVVGKKVDALYNIPGSVPSPIDMPDYCYFRDRCEKPCEKCSGQYPPSIRISDTHYVSCYRFFGEGEVVCYPKSVNLEEL